LRAIARIIGRDTRMPFPVICGTSAGAINATLLAVNADDFRRGVARRGDLQPSWPANRPAFVPFPLQEIN
jgi:NTE family protein